MHKVWLVTEANTVVSSLFDLGLVTPPTNRDTPEGLNTRRPPRAVRAARDEIGELDTPRRMPNSFPNWNFNMFVFVTLQNAVDAITELSRSQPGTKWYIFEATSFAEQPMVAPIFKNWNENGELQVR